MDEQEPELPILFEVEALDPGACNLAGVIIGPMKANAACNPLKQDVCFRCRVRLLNCAIGSPRSVRLAETPALIEVM